MSSFNKQEGFSHIVAIVAIVVVFGAIGAFMVVRSKAGACTSEVYYRNIASGSRCIGYIQELSNYHLKRNSSNALKIDKDFGPLTQKAVKEVQAKYGLSQDGKVGPKTWAKLCTYRAGDNNYRNYPQKAGSHAGCKGVKYPQS